jgi:5-methylcytosine-specific restriction endonuclease McrA
MFDDAESANADDNLITLCAPCHRRADAQYKGVKFSDGHMLRFPAGGAAWKLARETGIS